MDFMLFLFTVCKKSIHYIVNQFKVEIRCFTNKILLKALNTNVKVYLNC